MVLRVISKDSELTDYPILQGYKAGIEKHNAQLCRAKKFERISVLTDIMTVVSLVAYAVLFVATSGGSAAITNPLLLTGSVSALISLICKMFALKAMPAEVTPQVFMLEKDVIVERIVKVRDEDAIQQLKSAHKVEVGKFEAEIANLRGNILDLETKLAAAVAEKNQIEQQKQAFEDQLKKVKEINVAAVASDAATQQLKDMFNANGGTVKLKVVNPPVATPTTPEKKPSGILS